MANDEQIENPRQDASDTHARSPGNTKGQPMVSDTTAVAKNAAPWRLVSILALLLVLASTYIMWPLWGPSLPNWMHTVLAPLMEAGRTTAITGRLDSLAKKLLAVENGLGAIKLTLAQTSEAVSVASASVGKKDIKKIDAAQRVLSAEIESLTARLDVFSEKIADLKGMPASSEAAAALDALVTNSNRKITALEKENSVLHALMKKLGNRVGALESQSGHGYGIDKRDALLLAVGQLRDVTRTANEFSTSFASIQALSMGNPKTKVALEILQKFAAKGVPNRTVLQRRFDKLSVDIVRASYVATGEGWIDQIILKLSKLVTFRRTGVEGALKDDIAGLVARVELLLSAGDLKAAVGLVNKFLGEPAKVSYEWLKEAEARLAVDSAVETLFQNALQGARGTGGLDG